MDPFQANNDNIPLGFAPPPNRMSNRMSEHQSPSSFPSIMPSALGQLGGVVPPPPPQFMNGQMGDINPLMLQQFWRMASGQSPFPGMPFDFHNQIQNSPHGFPGAQSPPGSQSYSMIETYKGNETNMESLPGKPGSNGLNQRYGGNNDPPKGTSIESRIRGSEVVPLDQETTRAANHPPTTEAKASQNSLLSSMSELNRVSQGDSSQPSEIVNRPKVIEYLHQLNKQGVGFNRLVSLLGLQGEQLDRFRQTWISEGLLGATDPSFAPASSGKALPQQFPPAAQVQNRFQTPSVDPNAKPSQYTPSPGPKSAPKPLDTVQRDAAKFVPKNTVSVIKPPGLKPPPPDKDSVNRPAYLARLSAAKKSKQANGGPEPNQATRSASMSEASPVIPPRTLKDPSSIEDQIKDIALVAGLNSSSSTPIQLKPQIAPIAKNAKTNNEVLLQRLALLKQQQNKATAAPAHPKTSLITEKSGASTPSSIDYASTNATNTPIQQPRKLPVQDSPTLTITSQSPAPILSIPGLFMAQPPTSTTVDSPVVNTTLAQSEAPPSVQRHNGADQPVVSSNLASSGYATPKNRFTPYTPYSWNRQKAPETLIIDLSSDEEEMDIDVDDAGRSQPLEVKTMIKTVPDKSKASTSTQPAVPETQPQGPVAPSVPSSGTQTPKQINDILVQKEEAMAAMRKAIKERMKAQRQNKAASSSNSKTSNMPSAILEPSAISSPITPAANTANRTSLEVDLRSVSAVPAISPVVDSSADVTTGAAKPAQPLDVVAQEPPPKSPELSARAKQLERKRQEIDDELAADDAKLAKAMADMERLQASRRSKLEAKAKLAQELSDKGVDATGMSHDDMQVKLEKMEEIQTQQAPESIQSFPAPSPVVPQPEESPIDVDDEPTFSTSVYSISNNPSSQPSGMSRDPDTNSHPPVNEPPGLGPSKATGVVQEHVDNNATNAGGDIEAVFDPVEENSVPAEAASPHDSVESGEIEEEDDRMIGDAVENADSQLNEEEEYEPMSSALEADDSEEEDYTPDDSEMPMALDSEVESLTSQDEEEDYDPLVLEPVDGTLHNTTPHTFSYLTADQLVTEGSNQDQSSSTTSEEVHPTGFTPYESPLKIFKGYRNHPEFLKNVKGGYKSQTYSNNIEPHMVVCPSELSWGFCSTPSCGWQHFKDMELSGTECPTNDPKDQEKWNIGIRAIVEDFQKSGNQDPNVIASKIADYRRVFVGDSTRILNLGFP
ncbi:hypothetical protein BT63DRAFT_410873 [Microthyrium microscopicum]|uniref:Uncharacterized protein n=1 Tax=Microthyrium microscopicum TaxID=703497 RepID=A0A6A6UQA9_9PEZI|nr:hypothetical protein BT63DRAFT_410873 [Microthyrium microscopicum]